MKPFAILLLPLLLLASSCEKAPVRQVHTPLCTWEEVSIPQEHFTEHIRTLGLSGEPASLDGALLVLATRDGGKGSPWTIRKAEPFRSRWDARDTRGDIRIVEWLQMEDTGRMTYHLRFLGEYLHGESNGMEIHDKDGPIIVVDGNLATAIYQNTPAASGNYQKVSGFMFTNKHAGTTRETFCGIVK